MENVLSDPNKIGMCRRGRGRRRGRGPTLQGAAAILGRRWYDVMYIQLSTFCLDDDTNSPHVCRRHLAYTRTTNLASSLR